METSTSKYKRARKEIEINTVARASELLLLLPLAKVVNPEYQVARTHWHVLIRQIQRRVRRGERESLIRATGAGFINNADPPMVPHSRAHVYTREPTSAFSLPLQRNRSGDSAIYALYTHRASHFTFYSISCFGWLSAVLLLYCYYILSANRKLQCLWNKTLHKAVSSFLWNNLLVISDRKNLIFSIFFLIKFFLHEQRESMCHWIFKYEIEIIDICYFNNLPLIVSLQLILMVRINIKSE